MNRIFKVIYSKTKHTWVVASELAKSHSRNKNGGVTFGRLLPGVLLAALLLTGAGSVSYAAGTAISGENNTASGNYSVTAAGKGNKATGAHSAVIGGQNNIASGDYSVTTAGEGNRATGAHSAVTGGLNNTATGRYSTAIGGGDLSNGGDLWWSKNANEAKADWSTIIGGYGNTIEEDFYVYSADWSKVLDRINADHSTIVGGHNNRAIGEDNFIAGGQYNTSYGYGASVYGGNFNFAAPYSMIVGGIANLTGAEHSYSLFGYYNQVANYQALAIGGQYERVLGQYSIGLGGGSTGRKAENATAIGNHSVVTTANGLALGYQSTTNKEGTISFGHEKGDVSGYDSKLKPDYDGYSPNDFENYSVDLESGKDNTGKVYTPTTYNEAYYNRLVKVADGQDAHDAVVVEQLKTLAAASDASNIGKNLTKVPVKDAGNIEYEKSGAMKLQDATADDKTANAKSWGTAIGTGTVTTGDDGSQQLVTGGTVYNALSKVKTHFYSVHSTDTSAGNYNSDGAKGKNSLAAGVDALASGANSTAVGFKATAKNDAIAVGDTATAGNNGIAVGMHATAGYGQNMALGYYASVAGGVSNSTALGYGSQVTKRDILPSDGSDGVISVGRAVGQSGEKGLTRRIINVRAGVKGTDAAAVSQLTELKAGDHVTITDGAELNDKGQVVKTISAVADGKIAKGDTGLLSGGAVYDEVHVDSDGNYIKSANTVAGNLEALDGKVKTNADSIEKNTADISTNSQNIVKNGAAIEKNSAAIATNAQNIEKNGAAIEKNAAAISTNAGNIEKNGEAIEKNTAAIATNANNIEKNSKAIEKNSAAISTNAENIEKNGLAIEKNSAAIKTNAGNIEKNGKAIEQNSAAIKTNAGNIEKISKTVEQTSARVATNSSNIEKNGKAIEQNSAAIKTNAGNIEKNGRDIETLQQTKADISLSNINDAGKTVINNLAKKAIDVKAGSSNVTVTPNDVKDGVETFTVDMAKDISVNSVTAKDVKTEGLTVNKEAVIGGVTIKDSTITGLADATIAKGSTTAVNAGTVYNETRVANDGHYIKSANTAGANLSALDNQVAANAGNIFSLNNRVGELGSRINKVGAGAAALAALHPLDFDPGDKWDFAAGVGNYRNETAAAVGLFYRPNARSMFNLGWTMGDNRNMVNGGFSIKLGKGSVYNDMSKAQMAETIATQSKEISAMKADNAAIKADYNALKADNEAKEKRIDALEKQMQEIMAKLGK